MVFCPQCGKGTVYEYETNSCVIDHSDLSNMECDPRNDNCGNGMFCSPTYMRCMKNMELGQKCPDFVGNDVITCNANQNLYCINGYCLPLSNGNNMCSMLRCQQGYRCDPYSGKCIKEMNYCNFGMPCNQGEFCNKHTNMCERYRNEGENCLQSDDYCRQGLKCSQENVCIKA